MIARIKKINGVRWSKSLLAWHLPDTDENRIRFKIALQSHFLPSIEGMEQIEKFKQHLRSKRYSISTVTTYSDALKSFFAYFREKPIAEISNDDVIVYNNNYVLKNNL